MYLYCSTKQHFVGIFIMQNCNTSQTIYVLNTIKLFYGLVENFCTLTFVRY